MSELERKNRLSIVEIQTQGKTTRQEIKESKHRKTALDIEHSRVYHVREEAERQRQHDLLVWDRKLELARLQAGVLQQSAEPNHVQSFTEMMNSFGDGSRMPSSSLGTRSSGSTSQSSPGELYLSPSASDAVGHGWGLQLPGAVT